MFKGEGKRKSKSHNSPRMHRKNTQPQIPVLKMGFHGDPVQRGLAGPVHRVGDWHLILPADAASVGAHRHEHSPFALQGRF